MSCAWLRTKTESVPTIGGGAVNDVASICGFKNQGQDQLMSLYSELFALKLEGSFPSNNCPYADQGLDQSKCPEHK